MRVLVVGAGIFGTTAGRALAARGHEVRLLEAGRPPHPLAESTDLSKIVRLEYGADEAYMALAERALAGWRRWNVELGEALFHETGVAFLAHAPLAPGGFEADSLALLLARGHRPERLDAAAIARRFPAFRPGAYVDGFYDPEGGWVSAGRVVTRLAAALTIVPARALGLILEGGDRVAGVIADDGARHLAETVVLTTGAWIGDLAPWLGSSFRAVGQPVFHLAVDRDPGLPVFGADIANTGWYGFPATEGVVKLANHGVGRPMHPDQPRQPTAAEEAALRAFLAHGLPSLADAPIVYRRTCVYGDSLDEHFWIAADPAHPGLVVATGGSGHAFKFAPVLGDLIADAVEGKPGPPRFRWRPELERARGEEAARHRDPLAGS